MRGIKEKQIRYRPIRRLLKPRPGAGAELLLSPLKLIQYLVVAVSLSTCCLMPNPDDRQLRVTGPLDSVV